MFTYFTQYAVTLTQFSDGFNGSDLDNLYLRLDGSNDPIQDDLHISTGTNTGTANLELEGRRSGNSVTSGRVTFKDSLYPGYTGYFGWHADDNDRYFSLTDDLHLSSGSIKNITSMEFPHNIGFAIGSIDGNGDPNTRITFRFPSNSNDGNSAIEFGRYPASVRRGFAFRGKIMDGGTRRDGDLLWSYNNSSGADAVNYSGKVDGSTNIQTKASVESLIANAYVLDEEGDVHFYDHRLEDVGAPVAATDAATKGYVDTVISRTWTYVEYTGAPPADGTVSFRADTNNFYISGVTREGEVLVDGQSAFNEYALVAPASMYDRTDGGALRAFFKTSNFRVQNYGGKTYFKVGRGGYAKQQLTENHNYSINIPGFF